MSWLLPNTAPLGSSIPIISYEWSFILIFFPKVISSLKNSVFKSGPMTTTLLEPFTSFWDINLPLSTSKLLTSKNSGVIPAIEILRLFEFDWTISFAEIWGATFLTLGTCFSIA